MTHSSNTDVSVSFLLPYLSLKGRLVRLKDVSTSILSQHDYPDPVARALANLLSAGASLAGLLNFQGILTLQTKTSGPINLSVVDVTHDGNLRGYAQFDPKKIKPDAKFAELFGKGYMAFTIDQGSQTDRYQGIVELQQESLSQTLEHYLSQSEQLETRILLATTQTENKEWQTTALLLQQLPSKEVSPESWEHIRALLGTLSDKEFLDFSIPTESLLTRLFHEVGLEIFDPVPLNAKCRCSKERIKAFLATLSEDEIESLLEKGQLKMTCEFCNHHYVFDRKDLMTVH